MQYSLKRPNAVYFGKKNEILPFEDDEKLAFFSQKNDAALMVVGSHSKKRPHNLTFVRMFDHQLLDMYELGIENMTPLSEIKGAKCSANIRPLMIFQGDRFDTDETYKNLKNYFLDFFNGENMTGVSLTGLEYVISVTAPPPGQDKLYVRSYLTQMKKSGSRTPRVELEPMGPMFDFAVRRTQAPRPEVWKRAIQIPKELQTKKEKNKEYDAMGDQYGRIHMEKQDLSKLQTRKMRGLKRRRDEDGEEDEDEEDDQAVAEEGDDDEAEDDEE